MNIETLGTTLPMMLAGMAGIFIVIGILVLAVYALNKIFR